MYPDQVGKYKEDPAKKVGTKALTASFRKGPAFTLPVVALPSA
jgi:hypothetical protein